MGNCVWYTKGTRIYKFLWSKSFFPSTLLTPTFHIIDTFQHLGCICHLVRRCCCAIRSEWFRSRCRRCFVLWRRSTASGFGIVKMRLLLYSKFRSEFCLLFLYIILLSSSCGNDGRRWFWFWCDFRVLQFKHIFVNVTYIWWWKYVLFFVYHCI